ncbi:MAG TPA: sensor histidine kinase, partial [Thiotrichales bacterium]|nr:sensor histidine kinase [Thiotrichales bacterium]
ALIPQRPETAERVIEDLAHLLRAGMKNVAHWHRLEEELELVAAYLEIESLRLGKRLKVDWQRKPVPGACRVPTLILQPLVENAVYHGIEPSPEGGTITILVSAVRGRLRLEVRNPAVAAGSSRQSRGNHMALANIRERLELAFGALARIESEIRDGEYRVRILMPIVEDTP